MSSMIGLPSDRALVEDDECSRFLCNFLLFTKFSMETFIPSRFSLSAGGFQFMQMMKQGSSTTSKMHMLNLLIQVLPGGIYE